MDEELRTRSAIILITQHDELRERRRVPLAVKTVTGNVQSIHRFVGDLNAHRVKTGVELGFDTRPVFVRTLPFVEIA